MKATDLMVGDYVKYLGNIYIVEEISIKGWVHLIYPKTKSRLNLPSDYIIDLLEPILFTPEILKLNGFNEVSSGIYVYDIKYKLNIGVLFLPNAKEGESKIVMNINCSSLHENGSNILHTCDINYVHELQHAFRLCNLNDLANNFKLE